MMTANNCRVIHAFPTGSTLILARKSKMTRNNSKSQADFSLTSECHFPCCKERGKCCGCCFRSRGEINVRHFQSVQRQQSRAGGNSALRECVDRFHEQASRAADPVRGRA